MLEENQAQVLETLFYYKVQDFHDFNTEAYTVTKDFKMGKMDPKQNHESSLSLKKDRDRQRLKNKGNFKKGL